MAGTVDKAAHAIRRWAFVDTALRLIQTRGYEQMSIQDASMSWTSSRGAFYHLLRLHGGACLEAVNSARRDAALPRWRPLAGRARA